MEMAMGTVDTVHLLLQVLQLRPTLRPTEVS